MINVFRLLNLFRDKIIFIIALITSLAFLELLTFSFLKPIIAYFSNANYLNDDYFFSVYKNFDFKNLILIFIIIFFIRCCLSIYVSYKRSSLVKYINDYLSEKIYNIYLYKDFNFFIKNNSSNLISNIINEIDKFSYRVVDSLIYLLTEFFLVFAILIFLFSNYFWTTLFLITFIILCFLSLYILYRSAFKTAGIKKSLYDAAKIENLQNSFYAIQNIKLDNLESFFSDQFRKNTKLASENQFILQFKSEIPKPLIELLVLTALSGVIFFSYIYLGFNKNQFTAMLGIYGIAIFRILPSGNRIMMCLNQIRFHYSAINIITKELDAISSNYLLEKIDSKHFNFNSSIVLENVNFRYNNDEKNILNNINLTINKNDIIAISGVSGSGKSTLLNIICGLLKPEAGKIFIDNHALETHYRSYQAKIGYVPQKIYLIDDTLKNNIIFGRHQSTYDDNLFLDVINKSDLKNMIEEMPLKENTMIGERGSRLSGGQQQRIGLARALYKKPEILILDEATSALDEKSEAEILKSINYLKKKITIILVSHKKSILDYAEKKFIIENGRIFQDN
jgi:ATP-binding cassette, subfamily B, bacterial PglK